MGQSFRLIEMSKRLSELRRDLLQVEKQVEDLRESIRNAETELLRQNGQPASPEDTLVARIVDGVFSRIAAGTRNAVQESKQYFREKEAARYLGVSVFALRSWRSKQSNNGPP
jgi:hypothetical protein